MVKQVNGLLIKYILAVSLLLIGFYGITSPPAISIIWDWANALGYIAACTILFLFIYTGQRRNFPSVSGKFFIDFHRHTGYVILVIITMHAGILLLKDPVLIEHLKITAPYYMLCGLFAFILMLIVTVSSFQSVRKLIWSDYKWFRIIHALIGVLIVLLIYIHIVKSRYYANSDWKTIVWTITCFLFIGFYVIEKTGDNDINKQVNRINKNTAMYLSYTGGALLCLIAWLIAYIHNS